MIDFGKLYCDLHPNQLVTNFCLKQTCMVGLCATCICTHTQFHMNNKSTPEYQNIRNTFSSMHEMIRKKITSLDNQKNRIDKITQFIKSKRKTIKQNVDEARRQAISVINKFFQNKQKSMLRQMESQQKKMGLHSETRMQSLMNSLSRQTSVLITSAQELNSQNFLQSYQRIKIQVLANANKLQDDVSRQLDRNEDFQTLINSNDEYLQRIVGLLQQSLHLSFKFNQRPLVSHTQQRQSMKNGCIALHNQKITTITGLNNEQNYSNPCSKIINSTIDKNNFSSMSFSNVPEINKQVTACFYQNGTAHQTTKSISLDDQNNPAKSHLDRQNRSFIRDLYKSDIIKQHHAPQNVAQSLIFKEKDTNQKVFQQPLAKSSSGLIRNHQSQIMIGQKSNQYQNNFFNQSRVNNQTLNYSMIESLQNQNSCLKNNFNNQSHLSFTSNRPSSMVKLNKNQNYMQKNDRINFVPQIFNPNQFNRGTQNQGDISQCKKVRKSGLSLLKANQPSSTSRSKLNAI